MANTYTLIASQTMTGNTTTVTFSSIPSTYTDLKFVVSARASINPYSAAWADSQLYFNGSNTSLVNRDIAGNGSTVTSNNGSNITIRIPSSGATASTFGNTEIYIPNYNSTSAYKPMSIEMSTENNANSSRLEAIAGLWSSNSAITSITITGIDSAQFVQYSSFYLYGIKNS